MNNTERDMARRDAIKKAVKHMIDFRCDGYAICKCRVEEKLEARGINLDTLTGLDWYNIMGRVDDALKEAFDRAIEEFIEGDMMEGNFKP